MELEYELNTIAGIQISYQISVSMPSMNINIKFVSFTSSIIPLKYHKYQICQFYQFHFSIEIPQLYHNYSIIIALINCQGVLRVLVAR